MTGRAFFEQQRSHVAFEEFELLGACLRRIVGQRGRDADERECERDRGARERAGRIFEEPRRGRAAS